MAKNPRPYLQILTANDLILGDVIYWADGNWVRDFEHAQSFDNPNAATDVLEKAAGNTMIVGAYLVDVRIEDGHLAPAHFREDFRAQGPSNYFHGKQEDK